MHALSRPPFLSLAFVALASTVVGGLVIPEGQTALVQFPDSMMSNQYTTARDKINGFTHNWWEKCLDFCGHQNGTGNGAHHIINVTPLRLADTASIYCYCCIKDPSGNCYSSSNPYNKTDPDGPIVWATPQVVAKVAALGVTTITADQVTAVDPVVLQVVTPVPQPGKAIGFHWDGPKSEIGGVYSAYFIDENNTIKVVPLVNDACIFPASMSGKIKITVSAASDPNASSIYIVARTTLTVAPLSKRELRKHHYRSQRQ